MIRRFLPFIMVIMLATMVLTVVMSRKDRSMSEGLDDFIPPDISVIDRIIISQYDKELKLQKKGGTWLIAETTDQREISDYLNFFGKIPIYRPNKSMRDCFTADQPFARIIIRVRGGTGADFRAFRCMQSSDGNGEPDRNRYIAIRANSNDTVLVNYTDTDPVLRQIGDFQKN